MRNYSMILQQLKYFFISPKITYGITVCNEYKELKKLLSSLSSSIGKNDEIIVLKDVTTPCEEVDNVLLEFKDKISTVVANKLNGDFAGFKNNLIENSTKDYLFQIDADEYLQKSLIKNIKTFLRRYYYKDIFAIPRINIVHGITDEYIKKWSWKIDDNKYINYPDYQERLFKLKQNIHWVNKLHERLVGSDKLKRIPSKTTKFCIIHEKTMSKQIEQSNFYNTI